MKAVLDANRLRSEALVAGDAEALRAFLHPEFRWASHRGDVFTRDEYVDRNTGGKVDWRGQELEDVSVVVDGATAVLHAIAVDDIGGRVFRMPMTQTWVDGDGGWRLLAGHAGPLLDQPAP